MNFNFVGKTHENKLMDEIQSDCFWEQMQIDFDTSEFLSWSLLGRSYAGTYDKTRIDQERFSKFSDIIVLPKTYSLKLQ